MPELRKDPIVDRWVIIAPERAARPHEFTDVPQVVRSAVCPFCEGNERQTPHEAAALRTPGSLHDGPGWQARIVPNLFPALGPAASPRREAKTSSGHATSPELFISQPAVGVHEVVIESPTHLVDHGDLPPAHWSAVLRLVRDRMAQLGQTPGIRYVQHFKNVGEAGGASLEHVHSQLMALTEVPPAVQAELEGAEAYHGRVGRCVFCDLVECETAAGVRVVEASDQGVVLSTYAARFSYELLVVPRRHSADFTKLADRDVDAAAQLLLRTLRRLERALPGASYNVVLHTAGFDSFSGGYYHWHWEILPRLAKAAGFEWGTGIHINTVLPETAAEHLRRISAD